MRATSPTAGDLLFPAGYRRRVLSLLLLHPDRALHVREIARLTGTTAGTVNKELSRLHRAGLLQREAVGNQVRYSADRESPIYEELSSILRKTVGLADVLADALTPAAETGAVELAFVFGSIARSTESPRSDVDVMLIGEIDLDEAVRLLYPAGVTLGREVNPKIYTKAQWRKAMATKEPFVREILAQPKIYLIGNDDELESAGRQRSG
jgi:predicted nucleotidyltransferase